jgi:hypothetical protein
VTWFPHATSWISRIGPSSALTPRSIHRLMVE